MTGLQIIQTVTAVFSVLTVVFLYHDYKSGKIGKKPFIFTSSVFSLAAVFMITSIF